MSLEGPKGGLEVLERSTEVRDGWTSVVTKRPTVVAAGTMNVGGSHVD